LVRPSVEDLGPAHSANDVLTTVAAPSGRYKPEPRERFQARLFDVSWTVARILGVEEAVKARMREGAGYRRGGEFVGRPLIALPE
jgi:hypothetical protein